VAALKVKDTVYREADPTRVGTIRRIYTKDRVRWADIVYTTGEGEKHDTWRLEDCILAS
jgi:hypothetical protein